MSHSHNHSDRKDLSLAFWLNVLFSVIEVVGGILTNSTAILADAFHDFADAIAIGLAVLLEKLSGKKRTPKFSYGYKRFSLLSAIGMSLFLLIGAVFMCISAYHTFINPQIVDGKGMLFLAILGVAVNGFAFLRIKKPNGHSHHHGHSHSHDTDFNRKAIMLHLLEDVLGWVAVLIGAVVIYFTGWYWVDGVLAIAIAIFIGYNATKNLISTMKILMQSVPANVDVARLSDELLQIPYVENIHDLHIWTLEGSYHVGSLHAVVHAIDKNRDVDILPSILKVMEKYKILHPTIQIETARSDCRFVSC
ncbi:cation diffusion facilitator family transporter [Algoriphagus sp. AGSA1]|uniref:cation diffusion facilitator family transporter n=1 Tax=Algoriphagus sp. AGSA1 TaxID=2907213 RepID=UPI001F41DCA6|nr:cation diffusion facilitator family transporter [Algoriphagus sp. AGSA1]MCE7057961.1 cation diffusion facilitator family transporter [Algoriphagus sp. AGSA1]